MCRRPKASIDRDHEKLPHQCTARVHRTGTCSLAGVMFQKSALSSLHRMHLTTADLFPISICGRASTFRAHHWPCRSDWSMSNISLINTNINITIMPHLFKVNSNGSFGMWTGAGARGLQDGYNKTSKRLGRTVKYDESIDHCEQSQSRSRPKHHKPCISRCH